MIRSDRRGEEKRRGEKAEHKRHKLESELSAKREEMDEQTFGRLAEAHIRPPRRAIIHGNLRGRSRYCSQLEMASGRLSPLTRAPLDSQLVPEIISKLLAGDAIRAELQVGAGLPSCPPAGRPAESVSTRRRSPHPNGALEAPGANATGSRTAAYP